MYFSCSSYILSYHVFHMHNLTDMALAMGGFHKYCQCFNFSSFYGRPMEQGRPMRPLYFHTVSFFFISSPNLSGRRFDVYHTSTHGVALVWIQNAGLKCAARGLLKIQDSKMMQKITIWAPSHNFVGLYLRRCPHNMVNFGPLAA